MQSYRIRSFVIVAFTAMFLCLGFQTDAQATPPIPIAPPTSSPPISIAPPIYSPPISMAPSQNSAPTVFNPHDGTFPPYIEGKRYCGPGEGLIEVLVAEGRYYRDHTFSNACYLHDKCYATPGVSKSDCDIDLYINMISVCESDACEWQALTYYGFVDKFGQSSFNTAQRNTLKPSGIGSWIEEGRQNTQNKYGSGTGEIKIETGLEATIDQRFIDGGKENKFVLGISKDYENALLYYGDDQHNSQFGYVQGNVSAGYERNEDGEMFAGVGAGAQFSLFRRTDEVGNDVLYGSSNIEIGTLKADAELGITKSGEFTVIAAKAGAEAIAIEGDLEGSLKITPKVIYDHLISPAGLLLGLKPGVAPDWLDHGFRITASAGGGFGAAATAEASFGKTQEGYELKLEAEAGAGLFGKLGLNLTVL